MTYEDTKYRAELAYWEAWGARGAGAAGTDNLSAVAELASSLAVALKGETPPGAAGRLRLVAGLADYEAHVVQGDFPLVPPALLVAHKERAARSVREEAARERLDSLIDYLDVVARVAARSHRQPHGNQKKGDLRAAYDVLAEYYRAEKGKITSSWMWCDGAGGRRVLVPQSAAARFFLDALTAIDPWRDGLAEGLRDIMKDPCARSGKQINY